MLRSIVDWAVTTVTKPWHAEIQYCPAEIRMGAAPTVQVNLLVQLFSVFLVKRQPDDLCSLRLHAQDKDGSRYTEECNGHTDDGLHLFTVSFGDPGEFDFSLGYGGESVHLREKVILKVLPAPLDSYKSTFRIYSKNATLTAGDFVTISVCLRDEQGKCFNRQAQLSLSMITNNLTEKPICTLLSTKSSTERDVALLKAGKTELKVRANGDSITYNGFVSDTEGLGDIYPFQVTPNILNRIVFGKIALSMRGDGKITHNTGQLWVGVPCTVPIKEILDKHNNNTSVKPGLSAYLSPNIGAQYLTFVITENQMKIVIKKCGVYNLILTDVSGGIIQHCLPTFRVEQPPLDYSKSMFEIFCRNQDLIAGEKIKFEVNLRNVEGNEFHGSTSLSFFRLDKDKEILIGAPMTTTASSNPMKYVLQTSGNYHILIKANEHDIKYIGTHTEENGYKKENEIKVRAGPVSKIVLAEQAYSLRGDGKIYHSNYQMWLGVQYVVDIRNVFDQFGNKIHLQDNIVASLEINDSKDCLTYVSSNDHLKLVINQTGEHHLILKVQGVTLNHNIQKLRVDEPPIDLTKCSYEIYATNPTLKAGDRVKFKVKLTNVQDKPYKGPVDLSFHGQYETQSDTSPIEDKKQYNSMRYNIEHFLQVCKVGKIELFVKSKEQMLNHNGTYFEGDDDNDKVCDTRWIQVVPSEAKSVVFEKIAHTMGQDDEINHPNHQLWINRPCTIKIYEAFDLYNNETSIPKEISASLIPKNAADSLIYDDEEETLYNNATSIPKKISASLIQKNAAHSLIYDDEEETVTIVARVAGEYRLVLKSKQTILNHDIDFLIVLKPSAATMTVTPMYDLQKYAQNIQEDSLPLVGLPFDIRIDIGDGIDRTHTEDFMEYHEVALVRNSDLKKKIHQFQYWHTCYIHDWIPVDGPTSDMIWLKIDGIKTDVGVKIRGLEEFDEESMQIVEHDGFDRIICYHGANKMYPRLIRGDDNVNLQDIARVTDVIIESKDIIQIDDGVSLDMESNDNDNVFDMIKLLLTGKHFRRVASYHDGKRRHFAKQTKTAYANNDFVDRAPTVLKSIKCKHADLMEIAHNKAMDAYYEFHNRNRTLSEIDLHDLRAYKNRAEKIPGEAIDKLLERMKDPQLLEEYEWLEIIVGAGHHSQDQRPQIRPMVEEFLQKQGHEYRLYVRAGNKYDVISKGSLLLTFKKYEGPEPCYGQFYCHECHKVWWSRYSWSGYKQTCLKCESSQSLPYKMSEMRPYCGPVVRKRKNWAPNPVHCEEICEKCQELGYLCVSVNSKGNVNVAKYT